ncbi:enoyl-CoA hydratase-related protein [Mycobacterium sp. CVI_P3]|uniref:Enoyl-CoA hydratase-related protein n=1 Tax=Mycobacterium pinniadriaticum TaxID=2994102 RepID=A0ABT3SAF0_9MYCO|nr:enoyl-CoA hydratase-related protein [Mycobacterium pinniadriaticum]MCX2929887.1 enoyl-CoA hydratase-related protein [Mycobacterium pinniadriaticum]MCX2936464.1 enoyl-CoA hydratase-related protein [Mycobacterium pinniadriaticum]
MDSKRAKRTEPIAVDDGAPPAADVGRVDLVVHDGVATVWLNNPSALNAFTTDMVDQFLGVLDAIDSDDAIRVAVVTGHGRGFCSGADLSMGADSFARDSDESADGWPPPDRAGTISLRMMQCRKPLIAAINGPAVGFGASLTLPMDVRLAGVHARAGFPFVRRGIVPDGASSWFLPRIVGISRAAEWMITGKLYSVDELLDARFVRSVHPVGQLLPAAHALANEFVEQSAPVSVAVTRQLLWQMYGASGPLDAHRIESEALARLGSSPDAREGVQAFLERRPARFSMSATRDFPDVFRALQAT